MLCAVPFRDEGRRLEYPCGQCLTCRINKRREWTTRIILETTGHRNTEWCTLTYAPEFLPPGGTLVPSHLSYWVRMVRQFVRRSRAGQLRYFGVGEYGSKLGRPHYHVFLFGLMPWERDEAARLWKYGHVMWAHDPLNSKIAEYTAGYTVKKEGKDAEKLGGKSPEFSRMSLRPPIGGAWAEEYGASLASSKYFVESIAEKGFPAAIRFGGKMVPLGRTLSRYLRRGAGYEDPSDAEKAAAKWLRDQVFVNEEYQRQREVRRAAGVARARARQKLFAKQEKL